MPEIFSQSCEEPERSELPSGEVEVQIVTEAVTPHYTHMLPTGDTRRLSLLSVAEKVPEPE